MISVFIYTGIACFIFFFILKKKLAGESFSGYSAAEITVFLLLMRVCPLLMLEERSAINYIAFAADLIFLAMVSELSARLFSVNRRNTAALYLFSPLPVISIVCGEAEYILPVLVSAAIFLAFLWCVKKRTKGVPLSYFLNDFIIYSAGAYTALADKLCFTDKKIPVLTVIGISAVLIALVSAVIKLFRGKASDKAAKARTDANAYSSDAAEKFGTKNIIHIALLTLVYAAVVFFRLGSFDAPRTSMTFSGSSNSEIILDLGEYANVEKLDIFLGYKNKAVIAVSDYSVEASRWILFDEERQMDSVFAWNKVPVRRNLRYIGIVFINPEQYTLLEIAIIDADGNVLTPINASDYPQLFDEQEKYPGNTTYYYGTMFDEVYHGRTAYEFLHDLPIYENTHPPFGKTLISLGIAAFGMTPFGWRFVPAVFGILMVPLIYLFVWKLSHRGSMAFMGAILFCTEFMHFTLSRIATIDIIAAFFIMLMFFFMYNYTESAAADRSFPKQSVWLILCGISTALAVSTKWTGVYAAIGIAVIFFACTLRNCKAKGGIVKSARYLTKLCVVCVVSFIIIPAAVYCLSYTQFSEAYTNKNCIEHAVSNSISMLNYHSGIKASHPYESEWYEWLIDRRSVLYALTYVSDGSAASTVSTFGNPLILICGLIAFLHNFRLWRCNGSAKSGFLVIAYLSMLMPWFFIHRTVFIYQYFVCIIIIILMICVSVGHLKHRRKAEIILMCASFVLFVMFFPAISGIAADKDYINMLQWLPTWVFI